MFMLYIKFYLILLFLHGNAQLGCFVLFLKRAQLTVAYAGIELATLVLPAPRSNQLS